MRLEIFADAASAGTHAARLLAGQIAAAIARSGHAAIALSGGRTPAVMLEALAAEPVDWQRVHIFQVDERLVPDTDGRRNVHAIHSAFANCDIPTAQLHAMPVADGPPETVAAAYSRELRRVTGSPPVLDSVHLGLGDDGHTASLFPGDPAAGATGDTALTGTHGGVRRMTLTLETINRARAHVWLVTGAAKRAIVDRFLAPDAELVANRVRSGDAVLVLDRAAAGDR